MRWAACLLVVAAMAGMSAPAYADRPDASARAAALPLAGRVVVLDPGHQLGNHNFPQRIDRQVADGRGGRKACNTTGTATNAGLAEATFTWRVARMVQARLERLGATVRLTRTSNRSDRWGPCVDVRGRAGTKARADLELSIHGDGNLRRGARGFHVIAAPDRNRGSLRLARTTRAALERQDLQVANYIAGGDGLDVRTDLATLNWSRVPTVIVELGNMRDRVDARRMASPAGRATYAAGLVAGVRRYLD